MGTHLSVTFKQKVEREVMVMQEEYMAALERVRVAHAAIVVMQKYTPEWEWALDRLLIANVDLLRAAQNFGVPPFGEIIVREH